MQYNQLKNESRVLVLAKYQPTLSDIPSMHCISSYYGKECVDIYAEQYERVICVKVKTPPRRGAKMLFIKYPDRIDFMHFFETEYTVNICYTTQTNPELIDRSSEQIDSSKNVWVYITPTQGPNVSVYFNREFSVENMLEFDSAIVDSLVKECFNLYRADRQVLIGEKKYRNPENSENNEFSESMSIESRLTKVLSNAKVTAPYTCNFIIPNVGEVTLKIRRPNQSNKTYFNKKRKHHVYTYFK